MQVLGVRLEQEQLYVAFGTQKNGLRAVLARGKAESLEVKGEVEQTAHDIDKFIFREEGTLELLLVDGTLEGEVVVAAEHMNNPMPHA